MKTRDVRRELVQLGKRNIEQAAQSLDSHSPAVRLAAVNQVQSGLGLIILSRQV